MINCVTLLNDKGIASSPTTHKVLSINDVTALGKGVRDFVSIVLKSMTKGKGVKKLRNVIYRRPLNESRYVIFINVGYFMLKMC